MHVDASDADVAADEVAADADLDAAEVDVRTEALEEIEEGAAAASDATASDVSGPAQVATPATGEEH